MEHEQHVWQKLQVLDNKVTYIAETQSTKNTVSIRYWTNTPHSLMGHDDARAKVSTLQEDTPLNEKKHTSKEYNDDAKLVNTHP